MGVALLLVSLALVGFVATAEAAFASLPRFRRAQSGGAQNDAHMWFLEQRRALQVTLLVANTAGIVFLAVVARRVFFPEQSLTWENVFLFGFLLIVLLIVCQAVPYALASRSSEKARAVVKLPLQVADILLRPVTIFYHTLVRLFGGVVHHGDHPTLAEELAGIDALVEEIGEEPEDLEQEEREMIRGIMHLDETTVRDIMVPRMDIIAADVDESVSNVIDLIVQHGFSRIPIYEETIDNVVGLVYAKDLLKASRNPNPSVTLRSLLRKPHFVPESKKVSELLEDFRKEKVHVAIVIDEYGGTAGLVSLEDLLEEIVGEIEDEYDTEEKAIEILSKDEALLDARVPIDDLNELFGTEIEPQDFATVGGLIYAQLGKMPNVGDEVQVNGLTISVVSTMGRRIKKVRAVHRQKEEPAPASEKAS